MKKIFLYMMAVVAAAFTFTSCSKDNDYFFTAGEDDFPQILNTDIPETSGGEASQLPSINRNNNFKFTVLVTPANYTKVTWEIDGEAVADEYLTDNGRTIDIPLLAGVHSVKIIATTTKGKQTWRNCKIEVFALDGDPSLATDAKSRWLQVGKTVTISGENIENVLGVMIGKEVAADFKNNGNGTITFTVPEMADGNYNVTLTSNDTDESGAVNSNRYGVGTFTVSHDKYVEPGVEEVFIWEGKTNINWGDSNVLITAEQLADVPVGTVIKMYYDIVDADYHCMRITTPYWGDNAEDNLVGQFDLTADTPNPFTFTYTEACKALVDERGGMLVVGFGYDLTGVAYDKGGSAVKEFTLWEGATDINWGDSNVNITAEDLAGVEVGTQIKVYFESIDADYHCMRITTPNWGDNAEDNLVCQFDLTADTPNPFTFTYTEACKKLVDERGGMLIVGFGYKLTKVAYEKSVAPAKETTLWEGDTEINWGDSNVNIATDAMADVAVGQEVCVYYEIVDAEYHCMRITTPNWGDNAEDDLVNQFDLTADTPNPHVFTYTEACKKLVDERGGMLVVGFGYKLKKITVK